MPPEVVQRAEMLSGLSQSLIDVLPGRAVAGEDHSKVLGARCFFDHSALCVVDVVSGRMRLEQETLASIEREVAVSSCALDHPNELLGPLCCACDQGRVVRVGKVVEVALLAEDPRHHASLLCELMIHVVENHTVHDEEEVRRRGRPCLIPDAASNISLVWPAALTWNS